MSPIIQGEVPIGPYTSHEGDDSLMEGLAYPPAATPFSSLPISLDDLIGEQVNYGTGFTHELCFL